MVSMPDRYCVSIPERRCCRPIGRHCVTQFHSIEHGCEIVCFIQAQTHLSEFVKAPPRIHLTVINGPSPAFLSEVVGWCARLDVGCFHFIGTS